ncbi:uncharacterized protein [Hetaerina americana]|uniref:uncharacterized protein n=1 Tax=Hetaerina americana TaxID=62018 RepID=UPI003A7F3782
MASGDTMARRRTGLMSLPWPSFCVFLICLSGYCLGATYYSYDVTSDRICSRFRKREVDVFMTRPVIVESTPITLSRIFAGNSPPLTCTFEMEAKGSASRMGVVSVVQRMAFRSQGDHCVDYIQTIYHEVKGIKLKHKKKDKIKKKVLKKVAKTATGIKLKRDADDDDNSGPRICGDVLFGLHVDENETMPPPFAQPLPPTAPLGGSILSTVLSDRLNINPYQTLVSDAAEVDPKGELKTHLHLSNRMLRIGEDINLRVVYTAYQECDGRSVPQSLFHCGYGLCISSALLNDGFVNCPFGDCIDETNCTNAKSANITAKIVRYEPPEPSSSDSGGTIGGLVTFIIISVLIAFCVIYCCRKRKETKGKTYEPEDADDRGTELMDPSKQQTPAPGGSGGYYPTQPPAAEPPGYPAPPGGQPGYYPMGQPGYAPVPQQPPMGYPGVPPPQAGGQAPYPAAPMPAYPPAQGPGAGYPPYPPTASGTQEPQSAPMGTIGFNFPTPGSGYPAPTAPDA